MSNQNVSSSDIVVAFDGFGVPKLNFNFGTTPSLAMGMLIENIAENYSCYAHALVISILHEKNGTNLTTFDMLNNMGDNVIANKNSLSHVKEEEGSRTEALICKITEGLSLDFLYSAPIQKVVRKLHQNTALVYKAGEAFYGFPSLMQGEVVEAPVTITVPPVQPMAVITAVEVEPVEKPIVSEPSTEPKTREQSVDECIQNMLTGNKKFDVLVGLLKTEVEAMVRGNISYDEPLLARLLASEAGKILATISLRDFAGDKTIPKKMEMTATFLLEKAGVETPTDAKRKEGESAFKILSESPMIFDEIKDQMVKISGVEITMENMEEIFSRDVEISIAETMELKELVAGVETVEAKDEDEAPATSLGIAIQSALKQKGKQNHHPVRKAK